MKKVRELPLFFIVSILLIMPGCSSGNSGNGEKGEAQTEKIALVKVAKVQRGDIANYISLTGTVAPNRESRLGPKVEGKIERVYADVGDWVEKGKPLIKLEQSTYISIKQLGPKIARFRSRRYC